MAVPTGQAPPWRGRSSRRARDVSTLRGNDAGGAWCDGRTPGAGILSTSSGEPDRGADDTQMAVATTPYAEKTDDQKAMTEMVRQFVDEQIIPNAEHYDHEDYFPEPIVEQMKELGLFGVTIPEEYGGLGESPHHLHDDRRGALARLDLDLGHRQHALHRLLPADEVRHRGAEAEVPAEDGDRRAARVVLAVRARARLRRPGDQDQRHQAGRRQLRDQRPEDVGHQRPHAPACASCWSRPRRPTRPTRA